MTNSSVDEDLRPNYRDSFKIGAFISNNTTYHVNVYGKEYNSIPHMHVYNDTNDIEIMITKNKCISESCVLSDNFAKDFNEFMHDIPDDSSIAYKTNWEKAVFAWNAADYNNKKIHKLNRKVPNYSNLK